MISVAEYCLVVLFYGILRIVLMKQNRVFHVPVVVLHRYQVQLESLQLFLRKIALLSEALYRFLHLITLLCIQPDHSQSWHKISLFLCSHPQEYILPQNLDAQKFSPISQGESDLKNAVSSHSLPVCRVLHFTCPKAFSVASLTALK